MFEDEQNALFFSENADKMIDELGDNSGLMPQFFDNGVSKLWSYEQAAKFLSVSERTLKRKVKARKIHFIKIGRRVLFVPWLLRERVEQGGLL